ncbi:MAG: LysR family transcriptional regulator [Porticoccus sp.]|nr:MAG: LysR family transcriptional regulator [Porticoccus sp.]
MLDRIHLNILREVDRQGTLTGAADRLFLSQSALSHAIKKLEQQLGTPLWQKDGRRLRLTRAGEYLLGVAQRVLPQLEHAEQLMAEYAAGQRGILRIGMECHPCYQWLLKIVNPFLKAWPDVDVDVRQRFQFGGIGALFGYEIDLLITPDPLTRAGLTFVPVFDYEQVLVVARNSRLANQTYVKPSDLEDQTLITYPVEPERLDIFSSFLTPANTAPRRHKTIETTEIMLEMIAAGRGVGALPHWLVNENTEHFPVVPIRIGARGMKKAIYLGIRTQDLEIDYITGFVSMAGE